MIPLLSLPAELLTSILSCLDTQDLLACNATAKHLARLISASSHLQYTIDLTKHRLLSILPSHPKYPPYATRLKVLREREDAWRELAWKGRHTLQLPPTGSVYEFVGGIYGNGREDENRVTASISFLELPSSDFVPPTSTTPEDEPRPEKQLRTWTHAMGDVAIIDFTMDPSQNLLVLVALAPPDSKYIYNLHLRTISTNEPHPNAPAPILSCLERHPSFPPPPELFAAVRVQVSGDLVGLLIKEAPDPVGAHLEIWNWENDPYYTCSMSSQHGIDDFTFLSHSSFLIVLPVGRFEVYDFPDPLVSNHTTQNQNQDQSYAQSSMPTISASALPASGGRAKCTPTKKYSYDFPELSNGYMYWYISMSCNPAPGYVPLAGGRASNPFPPTLWGHGPGGDGGEGQVEEEDATKQLYYPLPDERIHACCVYIFNPNNHVGGNGLNAGNANANATHTHTAASAVASASLAASTPIPTPTSAATAAAAASTSNNSSAAGTNNSNNTLTDDDLDDENQQVHSFVFFLNLKTLLQPPDEWFQPPTPAQRESKIKTKNANAKKSKSDPAVDTTFAAPASSLKSLWKSSSSGSGSGSGSSVTEAESELVLTAPSWLSRFGEVDIDASISSSGVGVGASAGPSSSPSPSSLSSSSLGTGTSLDASLHALKRRQEEKELRDAQHKGVHINGVNGNGKRSLGKGKVRGSGSASPSSLSIEIPIGNGDDDDGMVDVPGFGALPVASELSIGAGASSSSSTSTSTSVSAYPCFPSFTSPGPHSSGKGKGKAKTNGSSTPTPGSLDRERVEKRGSVSRPGLVASSSSAGPSSPFNTSAFTSTSTSGSRSGSGSTPTASPTKGRAASTPPSTSHAQSNTAKLKSKSNSKPSSTSSSTPLFFVSPSSPSSSSSSSSSSSNTTTPSSSFIQPYTYHAARSHQRYDINQPISWETWGPSSTRWFEECLSTDWQHAIYGLRTVESVSVREREREVGRLWAERERERERVEREWEKEKEKERETQDVNGVKKGKGKGKEREDVCVDLCDGRDKERIVKGKGKKGKRKSLPDETQEESTEMDEDEDKDENEGCSRANGHAGPSRSTIGLSSSGVLNGTSTSGHQPQLQLPPQSSASNSTTATALPIRRRPRRFLRVRDFNPYSIKLAEAEVAAAQTLAPTSSSNGTRVNGIHTDSISASSLYMSKGKGKQRALPLPLSSSPSPLAQLSTVAHPYSYSYPIHLNVNSTLSSLLSHSLPSPLTNGYMSPPSSQISSSLSLSDSLSSSSSSDEPKANSNIWGKRRVVREPSITPVKGVFKKDIVSWLPYTEVVSEETFEVTDVMMDDCRLLLLKVRRYRDFLLYLPLFFSVFYFFLSFFSSPTPSPLFDCSSLLLYPGPR
ncbi:hypothetical protein P691DRAFT_454949 [Macrolepiota fuliginosa MF-IS2]|uniref:F-box domain-containing protein n=1 Tax=Macrolepiota fuliginosa MF-IS2 TaxID=1400762 RepID=A0A9P6C3Y0_9AGAR|nr:hypothetical protein P691DRAFT_454949 [Macrolepiota fuliginosa MF-IS2]